MKAREIKAQMVLKGITQRSIAKKLGITQPAISLVISRAIKSKRIESFLAQELGIQEHILWGDPSAKSTKRKSTCP
jgi:predicted transcriptional regulator